jgi:hypothetical protein
MARYSGWARFGIAVAILLILAILAHLGGGRMMGFLGKLHGR